MDYMDIWTHGHMDYTESTFTTVSNWTLLFQLWGLHLVFQQPSTNIFSFLMPWKILKYGEYKIWASASVRLSKLCHFFSSFDNRHQWRPQRMALRRTVIMPVSWWLRAQTLCTRSVLSIWQEKRQQDGPSHHPICMPFFKAKLKNNKMCIQSWTVFDNFI